MQRKILVFGNSGSGKSTLARSLQESLGLAHLDLDTLAWEAQMPPSRRPLDVSGAELAQFIASHESWVIEGCYADLLELAVPASTELIYMDLPVASCIANARQRPWEPHKYPSKVAQDANLGMLEEWIAQYPQRSDTCSRGAHEALFNRYSGSKRRLADNTSAAE